MPTQSFGTENVYNGIKCVFVIANQCPQKSTTFSICRAAESIEGVKVYGAQIRAGLWRIQPLTTISRILLLSGNLNLEGKQIPIHDNNPFLRGGVDDDDPSTQLHIDDLPWSVSDEAIDRHLRGMGLKLRTKLKRTCDRDPNDGGLTEYRTGRRSIWINIPTSPLPQYVKVGEHQAKLWHYEMKEQMQCRRCLGKGHKASECTNEEVCFVCHLPGHRKGDKKCKGKKHANSTQGKGNNSRADDDRSQREKEEKNDKKNYYCVWCDEYGHEKNDINECIFHIPGLLPGEKHPKDEELEKRGICNKCGASDHTEGSASCLVDYPPMEECNDNQSQVSNTVVNTAGSSNDQSGATGHMEGPTSFWVDYPLGNGRNEKQSQVGNTVRNTASPSKDGSNKKGLGKKSKKKKGNTSVVSKDGAEEQHSLVTDDTNDSATQSAQKGTFSGAENGDLQNGEDGLSLVECEEGLESNPINVSKPQTLGPCPSGEVGGSQDKTEGSSKMAVASKVDDEGTQGTPKVNEVNFSGTDSAKMSNPGDQTLEEERNQLMDGISGETQKVDSVNGDQDHSESKLEKEAVEDENKENTEEILKMSSIDNPLIEQCDPLVVFPPVSTPGSSGPEAKSSTREQKRGIPDSSPEGLAAGMANKTRKTDLDSSFD